jgi:hypothetical protein
VSTRYVVQFWWHGEVEDDAKPSPIDAAVEIARRDVIMMKEHKRPVMVKAYREEFASHAGEAQNVERAKGTENAWKG